MDTIIQYIKKQSDKFWWIRGVLFALSVITIAVQGFDWDKYKFARAFHAIILNWNILTGHVGDIISSYVPFKIGSPEVNAIIILMSLHVPWATTLYVSDRTKIQKIIFWSSLILLSLASFAFFIWTFQTSKNPLVALAIIIGTGYPSYIRIYDQYPSYFRGMIHLVVFLLTIEILYFVPLIRGTVDSISCRSLEISPEDC